jgi:hypothetical protein
VKYLYVTDRKEKKNEDNVRGREFTLSFHSSENIIRQFGYRKLDSAGHLTQYEIREIYKSIVM